VAPDPTSSSETTASQHSGTGQSRGEGRNQSQAQHSAQGHKTFHCTTSHQISHHHSTPPRTTALGAHTPLKHFQLYKYHHHHVLLPVDASTHTV
jgi:hypothetical protein